MPSTERKDPDAEIPLTPATFQLLLALSPGPSHGYELMQRIATMTKGRTLLGPGTLYRSLQQMVIRDFIEERPSPGTHEGDARRKVYRLTRFGRAVGAAEAQRLADLVREARNHGLLR